MTRQLDKCKCEFRIRMLGDGCRYCQPQEYIDRLHDTTEDMVHVEPLSDEEIMNTFDKCLFNNGFNAIEFAREIEKRHGIK